MIIIRKFKIVDTALVAEIVSSTFKRYNKQEGTKEAVNRFINFYNPEKNIEKLKLAFSKSDIFFIAVDNKKIIGMIRGRKNRVVNLFVDGRYHKSGVGSRLMEKFEKSCIKKGSKDIKLRASIYAVSFYEKAGYKKTTGIRNFIGLKICPMKKNINI
ncbi:GNAT family N-acetyltransferase [Candidatus Parcubacteria bacterium]|nr:GNAT family N-acetyltransferase [Candidatus Parcubacteria bacterium]